MRDGITVSYVMGFVITETSIEHTIRLTCDLDGVSTEITLAALDCNIEDCKSIPIPPTPVWSCGDIGEIFYGNSQNCLPSQPLPWPACVTLKAHPHWDYLDTEMALVSISQLPEAAPTAYTFEAWINAAKVGSATTPGTILIPDFEDDFYSGTAIYLWYRLSYTVATKTATLSYGREGDPGQGIDQGGLPTGTKIVGSSGPNNKTTTVFDTGGTVTFTWAESNGIDSAAFDNIQIEVADPALWSGGQPNPPSCANATDGAMALVDSVTDDMMPPSDPNWWFLAYEDTYTLAEPIAAKTPYQYYFGAMGRFLYVAAPAGTVSAIQIPVPYDPLAEYTVGFTFGSGFQDSLSTIDISRRELNVTLLGVSVAEIVQDGEITTQGFEDRSWLKMRASDAHLAHLNTEPSATPGGDLFLPAGDISILVTVKPNPANPDLEWIVDGGGTPQIIPKSSPSCDMGYLTVFTDHSNYPVTWFGPYDMCPNNGIENFSYSTTANRRKFLADCTGDPDYTPGDNFNPVYTCDPPPP